jgi:hypothetical protein
VCGGEEGVILGYPLGALKPDFEGCELMVSPLSFRCASCGRTTQLLDTAEHGEASEFAKAEAWEFGCAAYRGEGDAVPAACPACGVCRVIAVVYLSFHDDRVYDFEENPEFPLADYFDAFWLDCLCSVCGRRWEVSKIDTKP